MQFEAPLFGGHVSPPILNVVELAEREHDPRALEVGVGDRPQRSGPLAPPHGEQVLEGVGVPDDRDDRVRLEDAVDRLRIPEPAGRGRDRPPVPSRSDDLLPDTGGRLTCFGEADLARSVLAAAEHDVGERVV